MAGGGLQLAVLTTVYHWLQAFHDLRWGGKPDCQIGATHWQQWLQADAQCATVRGLGLAPMARALNASAPDRTLAPHRIPLANPPFNPAPESSIRKSVPLPPARGATEPTKCPLCTDTFYTSGAMLEHLALHAVHAAAPAEDKKAASRVIPGRARRSPWHAPYAQLAPPPPGAQQPGGPGRGRGGSRSRPRGWQCSHQGSISAIGLGSHKRRRSVQRGVHLRGTGPPVGPL